MSILGLIILFFLVAIVVGTVIALLKKPEIVDKITGTPAAPDEAPIEPPADEQ